MRYDVVVAGLGAMGSAAAYQLAKSGASVLGVDRFEPPHALGSSHGDTRITRVAVGEGLEYVPLVRRSHELWREIEQETGLEILTQCGGLVLAPPEAGFAMHGSESFLAHTVAAAQAYGVEHERLETAELAQRFPQFALAADEQGCYEPGAGFVRPEVAVGAQLRLAREAGAVLASGEQVRRLRRRRHPRRGPHHDPHGGGVHADRRRRVPGCPSWSPSWRRACGSCARCCSGSTCATPRRTPCCVTHRSSSGHPAPTPTT